MLVNRRDFLRQSAVLALAPVLPVLPVPKAPVPKAPPLFANPEWQRIVNDTIRDYVREEELNILRKHKLLTLLLENGRITMSHAGDCLEWKIRYRRAPLGTRTRTP